METDTHSIIAEHFGFDIGGEDWNACAYCGEILATNEEAEKHIGECNVKEQ